MSDSTSKEVWDGFNKMLADAGYEMIVTEIPNCPKCNQRLKVISINEETDMYTYWCKNCKRHLIGAENDPHIPLEFLPKRQVN